MNGWFVPGRIEVLGKHTDYAGGRSLLAATDLGVTVIASRGTQGITAWSDVTSDAVAVGWGAPALPAGHWGRYVKTVVDRLTANFGPLAPTSLEVTSNLPLASGMSSSSALVCGAALALADANGLPETAAWQREIRSREDLAGYLACVENGASFGSLTGHTGVGTFGGSEDHTAMLCCQPGRLATYSFAPTRPEGVVDVPAGVTFVVGVSGVLAEKTGAARDAYNAVAARAGELARIWRDETGGSEPHLGAIMASSPDAVARLSSLVAREPALAARLRQFVRESAEIVPAAVTALERHDLIGFGALVAQSMQAATEDLDNQVPETIALVSTALGLGAHAASAFGAGFGGSVWAMVDEGSAAAFAADWLSSYQSRFDHPRAATFVATASGPARPVE